MEEEKGQHQIPPVQLYKINIQYPIAETQILTGYTRFLGQKKLPKEDNTCDSKKNDEKILQEFKIEDIPVRVCLD